MTEPRRWASGTVTTTTIPNTSRSRQPPEAVVLQLLYLIFSASQLPLAPRVLEKPKGHGEIRVAPVDDEPSAVTTCSSPPLRGSLALAHDLPFSFLGRTWPCNSQHNRRTG